MSQAPRIDTSRLTLRPFTREDAADVFAYCSNPNVLRYTTGQPHRTLADTHRFLDDVTAKPPGVFAWAICLKSDPHVVGCVEFAMPTPDEGTIHYALAEPLWGKGIMTEASRAVLTWAFATFAGMQRVATCAVAANTASTRVMEKCAMTFQGRRTDRWKKLDHPVDLALYAVTRREWDAFASVGFEAHA